MPAQASQANDANRTDQDSPFALLMAANAPKEEKPAREQNDVEKPANDQPGAQPARPQSRTESKPKAKPAEKSQADEKAPVENGADNDGQAKKEKTAVSNDNAAPQTGTQTAQANPPPQIVVPLIVMSDAAPAVTPDTGAPEEPGPAIDTAATPPQPAAKPAQDLAAFTAGQVSTPTGATSQTAPEAMPPAAESVPQPQTQLAAAQQAPTSQTPKPETDAPKDGAQQVTVVPQVAAPETALQQAAAPQTTPPENSTSQAAAAKEIVVQVAALQNTAKPADSREPANAPAPETAEASIKTDTATPVTPVVSGEQAEHKDVKSDAAKPELVRTDSAKPDQPAPVDVAAPKAPPQTQVTSNTNMAVQGNTTPQSTTTPSVLPGIPQHVQVSAEAAKPSMPALAVEIAAKSQSGAKQFDIRLDPPELGRVEVRLSIDAAGKASAHLSADQPQTLELLQKDASSLTRALREAGLNVSQDGLNFSLRQQNHDGNGAQQGQGQTRHISRGMTLIAANSIEATQTSAAYRGDGRLDIRV